MSTIWNSVKYEWAEHAYIHADEFNYTFPI